MGICIFFFYHDYSDISILLNFPLEQDSYSLETKETLFEIGINISILRVRL